MNRKEQEYREGNIRTDNTRREDETENIPKKLVRLRIEACEEGVKIEKHIVEEIEKFRYLLLAVTLDD